MVNPNTIARVYTELEREGLIQHAAGAGRVRGSPRSRADRRRSAASGSSRLVDALLTEAVHLGFSSRGGRSLVSRAGRAVPVAVGRQLGAERCNRGAESPCPT